MNPLCELADQTWRYLQDLIDGMEEENQLFLGDTRRFFEERLSIYEKQRKELENHVEILVEEMNRLSDQLELPRISFDHSIRTLKEKKNFINEKIIQLKDLVIQQDKELMKFREFILRKNQILGNEQININQVRIILLKIFFDRSFFFIQIISTNQAKTVLCDLDNQLNQFKENIRVLFHQIHSINSEISSKYENEVNSFVSLDNDNELSWLSTYHPLTAVSLHSQLTNEYQNQRKILLDEIVHLRAELHQSAPPPPSDLLEELTNLRLRKRYLTLLSSIST